MSLVKSQKCDGLLKALELLDFQIFFGIINLNNFGNLVISLGST
jgi:hypothetical protein